MEVLTAEERVRAIECALTMFENREVERVIREAASEKEAARRCRSLLSFGGSYDEDLNVTFLSSGIYVGNDEDPYCFHGPGERRIAYLDLARHVRSASQGALFP